MVDRPILPIGDTLTRDFADQVAAYYRGPVTVEAARVAKTLAELGWRAIGIAYAGVDFSPVDWVIGPRTADPHDAVVTLAIVYGKRDWQTTDSILIEVAWDTGIVTAKWEV